MKNKNVTDFMNALKKNNDELLNNYKPKFNIGDVIINDKFKVVSIITNIAMAWPNYRDKNGYLVAGDEKELHYVMIDLENKAAREYFGKNNMQYNKELRKRWKMCKRLDSTYSLIDPGKAQLLYGKEIVDLKEKYENEKKKNNKRSSNNRDN